jgi:uncharacterized protein
VTHEKARPVPTPDTQPFWDGVNAGRLMMQRCSRCSEFYFYPRDYCPQCLSDEVTWQRLSGRGRLYSYVICHVAAPGFATELPYAIAIVELEEGPRMMANIVGVDITPQNLVLDMALMVTFREQDELVLPQFTPTIPAAP